jgi:prolipoprotein diacylglyceryl transferase
VLGAIPFRTFPVFHIGPLPIRTFGVFVALGIVVGVQILSRYARERGLDPESLAGLAFQVVGFGIVGARLLFVVTHLSDFQSNPLEAFAIWQGGLQFSGSFLVAIPIIWNFARRHPEVPGLVLTDGIVLALVPGMMIGRIGCASVGEHLGKATSFFLGWEYLGGETREGPIAVGTIVHSTALYEILLLAPLAILLFRMNRQRVQTGQMAATFFLWYGIQRLLTDTLRAYDHRVFGLTGAQYLCIGMILGGAWILGTIRPKRTSPPHAEPAA